MHMYSKGFTLVELLAVLVILAIIITIATISVNSVLSNSKNSVSDLQKKKIEEAAKVYYLKEGMNENANCVDVSDLLTKGYIEGSEIKDPKTKETIDGSVSITYAANKYSYRYQSTSCE